jgi:hypothetical protein
MRVSISQPQAQTLVDSAYQLLRQGLSVIPVHGGKDTHNAKIAAVKWNKYRERFATPQEIEHWFLQQKFAGIAVVCGRLSQLIVLDFDDRHAHEQFAAQFPTLTETYTIQSAARRTPHLYWRTDANIHGTNIHGGELRAEGQYIVTAPTGINGQQYTIQQDATIRSITARELEEALRFLRPRARQKTPDSPRNHLDIKSLYRTTAPTIGRNNALYKASQQAKQNHWTITETQAVLVPIHIEQHPTNQHKPETDKQRQQEALKTIESAFKHAKTATNTAAKGLPNTIREKLIETQKTGITARLVEALLNEQIKQFTEAQLTEIAQRYGIGRFSVLRALTGNLATITEQRVFPIVIEENMLCSATDGVKKAGRPARVYRLPNFEYFYNLLGVQRSSSDTLNSDDLRSGKRYRMALHRTLIERRPGEYGRGWLASRLGTSVRTIQRYNRALNVQVTPVYAYTRFDWDTIENVPLSEERERITPGRWLEDAAGKRYPALRALAYKLMKQNVAPKYVRRIANHYAFASTAQDVNPIWRCVESNTVYLQPEQGLPFSTTERAVQTAASVSVRIRECMHCGQLCFDDKLVCATCRHKRDEPASRITFDKDGKPRFPISYTKTLLTNKNILTLLPDDWQRSFEFEIDDPRYKAWLQTPDGKRYPTVQGLAFRLVKRYGEVFLVQRDNSTELIYNLGTNLLSIGARRMGRYYLRKAGVRKFKG